ARLRREPMQRPRGTDPFTLEIIKDTLLAIGNEMFVALQRTSKSPIIYEVLDYACGITDARGQMLAQGQGVTGFLGTLGQAVAEARGKFAGRLHPGDTIITNDPYGGGGTHPSDVAWILPGFFRRRMVRQPRRVPKSVFEAGDMIDDDGIGHGPFPVRVIVTITDDEFVCDFTGTHPQVTGPINATRTGLLSSIRTIFKAVTGPLIP